MLALRCARRGEQEMGPSGSGRQAGGLACQRRKREPVATCSLFGCKSLAVCTPGNSAERR